jgi:regulator of sirC expression with transglutaminase-like and TPR domain
MLRLLMLALLLLGPLDIVRGEESDGKAQESVQRLVARLKKSLVTIRSENRDGEAVGLGTGFVIDEKGLIATNFHVISEGRPIRVELGDRAAVKVLAVEASSRSDDLAILRVDAGNRELTALELAEEGMLEQGAEVLALGNPLGFRQSVTRGIVSGLRKIDGRDLIQLAIAVEPGNSGGPLVDLNGVVHGIVNMKSSIRENLGFAIPIGELKRLRDNPNPILIDRWVRAWTYDKNRWTSVMGGNWLERSGVMKVSGSGTGFGGRALCLSKMSVPENSFEVAVDVKLDDESGAAGLIFHSDGGDRHYGFYPSNGKLRLTCFLGANVLTWQIIRDVSSQAYLPGEWNRLRVAWDDGRIRSYVNDELVVDERHTALRCGAVGLAAFRETNAEFRDFNVSKTSEQGSLDTESIRFVEQALNRKNPSTLETLRQLKNLDLQADDLARRLSREAHALNQQADRLRRLAEDAKLLPIVERLKQIFEEEDDDDLLDAALLVSSLDHPDLEIRAYVDRIEGMAEEIRGAFSPEASDEEKLATLNRFLFEENGYRGGLDEFYHPANNHLDRVIDDREGMPIALSILYMELGRRLDLTMEGVGLPGRFVVRLLGEPDTILDVYDKARRLDDEDVDRLVMENAQRRVSEEDLHPRTPEEIIGRVLTNLIHSAERIGDLDALYKYLEGLLAVQGDSPENRAQRAVARYRTGRYDGAMEDFNWLLEVRPDILDIREFATLREDTARRLESGR